MSATGTKRPTAAKLERLQALMEGRGADAIVVSAYQSVSFFAGTYLMTQTSLPDRLAFVLVRRGGPATLLVCNIETSLVRSQSEIDDVREYVEFKETPAEALARLLLEEGLESATVGIEARRLPLASAETIRLVLPDLKLLPLDDEIELAQAVKEPAEIASLERAAKFTLSAVLESAEQLPAGATELELTRDITARMIGYGGHPAFLVFASGERTLHAHAEPADLALEPGKIWRIDLGARFDEVIYSDLARTGVVGEPTVEQEQIMAGVRAAQDAAFAVIEPGRPAKDVFHAVAKEFERQKLPFTMPHVGHGMGIGLHEFPMLEPTNETPLEVGMVLNIEPMTVMRDRSECYHTEDLAAVTESGSRVLTQPQDRLVRVAG